jgi:hypothetical protein
MHSIHKNIRRTSVLDVTLDGTECDLLVLWDQPNEHGEQPTSVELTGQATNWERVQLVREDDVHRGTYFHLLLQRMPVGIELRMKFRIDGVHTVDERYEVEANDGFGDKNNIFYVDQKQVTKHDVLFPVKIPFVGWALEAEQRGSISLESALLPQDMITTTRLYHSYMYMNKQKDKHPELSWKEIKAKAARTKVSKQKSKTLSGSMAMKSTTSEVRHFGRSAQSSSSSSSASFASSFTSSSASVRSSIMAPHNSVLSSSKRGSGKKSSSQRNSSLSLTSSTMVTGPPALTKRRKKRRPATTQAGTLTYCEGLSIYELENRMSAVIKESRSVAGGNTSTITKKKSGMHKKKRNQTQRRK